MSETSEVKTTIWSETSSVTFMILHLHISITILQTDAFHQYSLYQLEISISVLLSRFKMEKVYRSMFLSRLTKSWPHVFNWSKHTNSQLLSNYQEISRSDRMMSFTMACIGHNSNKTIHISFVMARTGKHSIIPNSGGSSGEWRGVTLCATSGARRDGSSEQFMYVFTEPKGVTWPPGSPLGSVTAKYQ